MRFYSAEWIDAFNRAVAGLEVAPDAAWCMVQAVSGAPEGSFAIALEVAGGRVRLRREPEGIRPVPPADVTVSISYDDAAALSRSELDPAQLLGTGRVKVRGDLSVLVKGQELLAEAAARVAALSSTTTY